MGIVNTRSSVDRPLTTNLAFFLKILGIYINENQNSISQWLKRSDEIKHSIHITEDVVYLALCFDIAFC